MKISLRPHHLLCLKGYKGLNYNQSQVRNWSEISSKLKENPDIDILIVSGRDDLCENCPAILPEYRILCKEFIVNNLDKNIQAMLGLVTGQVYKYKELIENLEKNMNYERHKKFCETCAWWKKGLCQDSFQKKL